MKTQIVHIEQNDDVLSVRDKLSWSQAGRVLLIWPIREGVLINKIDLVLVKRYAASIGVQLAMVSCDRKIDFLATLVGVPIFKDLLAAQDHGWDLAPSIKFKTRQKLGLADVKKLQKTVPPPTSRWGQHWIIRYLSLSMSLMALIILGLFIVPGAKVTLSPGEKNQSMNFIVCVNPSVAGMEHLIDCLPTYSLKVTIEGQEAIAASGSMRYPEQPATGMLVFNNTSDQTTYLPGNTIVATSDTERVRFVTANAEDLSISPNRSIVIEARAVKPGIAGNLAANTLVVIENGVNPGIEATNPYATSGGSEVSVTTPTARDIETLRARVIAQAKKDAYTELRSLLSDGDIIITSTIKLINVTDETLAPAIGEPGNILELTAHMQIQADVVSGESLRRFVALSLDANIPDGFKAIPGSSEVISLSVPRLEKDGKVYWSIAASQKLQADINIFPAAKRIRGITIHQAQELLSKAIPLMRPAEISIDPPWWPRLPLLAMRISLVKTQLP